MLQSVATALITSGPIVTAMPKTLEVVCNANDCELDMFELHYTYDMPDEVGLTDFQCPYCSRTDVLSEVQL